MPQREEVRLWYQAVYRAVQLIPAGRCTSYGHIALLLGSPQRARQVGVCLQHLPRYDPAQPERHAYNSENVPWQRVLNVRGGVSARGDGGLGAQRQVERLQGEGVTVAERGNGTAEHCVDLQAFGWFPSELPGGFFADESSEETA
jgi:methylated-DNA-protein-cysteine methyltransferase related protein